MTNIGQKGVVVGRSSANGSATLDRRVARTDRALMQAFVDLMQERNYRDVKIADIVGRADVGRSTFYDHFRDKDDILLASMGWMFSILADAVQAEAPRTPVDQLVSHFWANRGLARAVLVPPVQAKLARALTAKIEDRIAADTPQQRDSANRRLLAVGIAAGQLGILGMWTRGELTAKAEEVSEALITISRAGR